MQKDYFLNGGGTPPPLQFEPTVPDWNSSSQYQYAQFESAVSSMPTSSSAVSGGYAISELIGKLGNICGTPPPFTADMSTPYAGNNDNNVYNYNTETSCYTTPLNSPPKLHMPSLVNSLPPNPSSLPTLSGDPGYAERAAKFSCLGNRSFNSKTGQFGLTNDDLPYRSNTQCIGNGKLPRVSSSPSLKQTGSPVQIKNLGPTQAELKPENPFPLGSGANSNEEFAAPEQPPSGPKTPTEMNPRKRKTVSRRKAEEDGKGIETDDHSTEKRSKPVEATGSDYNGVKTEEEQNGPTNNNTDAGDGKPNQTPPEPPKDYIHVRARRGQATDSHSLAERVRREKISERMKLLQDLVPGCSKVTGKALMLDEIINYVQSLQQQVEFLSMKLATVNPWLDFNIDNLLPKDICQSNASLPHPVYPLDSSAPAFHGQHLYPHKQIPQLHTNFTDGAVSQCPIYPLDTSPSHSLGVQFPPVDGFAENLTQFRSIFEDDLQSIVHMGFNRISSKDTTLHPQNLPRSNPSNENGASVIVHLPLI